MDELIYLADPMCSWCYGFRDEVSKLKEYFAGSFEFTLIMGGLRPGGGEEWNDQFKDFLRHHWEQVAERSGQPFQFELFDRAHFNYDTEPPCRAVRIVRDLAPEKEFDFFKAVQYEFYYKNHDPADPFFYQPICAQLDIPYATFADSFQDPDYREKTRADFRKSADLGVRSFPTVLFRHGDQLGLVANGWMAFEQMRAVVTHFQELVAADN